jgi:UDP-N-acetylglucosamine:LPS N-acetylglucosamine transferase
VSLSEGWSEYSRAWVTLDKSDARSMLASERVIFAHGPTQRNTLNLVRNAWLACRVIRELRPRVIVTTGAALAVPFAWVGRCLGVRVVYVESLTRITEPSLTLRLVAPVADRIYAQWPELRAAVPQARYAGGLLSGR